MIKINIQRIMKYLKKSRAKILQKSTESFILLMCYFQRVQLVFFIKYIGLDKEDHKQKYRTFVFHSYTYLSTGNNWNTVYTLTFKIVCVYLHKGQKNIGSIITHIYFDIMGQHESKVADWRSADDRRNTVYGIRYSGWHSTCITAL